jgi:hypothetical protein
MPMSILSDSLQELFTFLDERELSPPSRDVRFIEIQHATAIDSRGCFCIRQESLRTPSEYETRFEELINSGFSWLNMSCYGVYKHLLIVGIEIPCTLPHGDQASCLSVNYSGPPVSVIQSEWDASEILSIE